MHQQWSYVFLALTHGTVLLKRPGITSMKAMAIYNAALGLSNIQLYRSVQLIKWLCDLMDTIWFIAWHMLCYDECSIPKSLEIYAVITFSKTMRKSVFLCNSYKNKVTNLISTYSMILQDVLYIRCHFFSKWPSSTGAYKQEYRQFVMGNT